jgi:hypothetical protein
MYIKIYIYIYICISTIYIHTIIYIYIYIYRYIYIILLYIVHVYTHMQTPCMYSESLAQTNMRLVAWILAKPGFVLWVKHKARCLVVGPGNTNRPVAWLKPRFRTTIIGSAQVREASHSMSEHEQTHTHGRH